MMKWQISLRDLLVICVLIAVTICLIRIGNSKPAILFGFLPGSYLATTQFRHGARRNWEDCLRRIVACALGGSLSCPTLTIGSAAAMGMMVQSVGATTLPLPAWFWVLILVEFTLIGAVLGAIHGAVETAILWRNVRGPNEPNAPDRSKP